MPPVFFKAYIPGDRSHVWFNVSDIEKIETHKYSGNAVLTMKSGKQQITLKCSVEDFMNVYLPDSVAMDSQLTLTK